MADGARGLDGVDGRELEPLQTVVVDEEIPGEIPFEWVDDDAAELVEGQHPSYALTDSSREAVEQCWREVWRPLLLDDPIAPGVGVMERLKAELFDFYHLIRNARAVYLHVTGGNCDRLEASAEGIITMADHRVGELTAAYRRRIEALEAETRQLRDRLRSMEADW